MPHDSSNCKVCRGLSGTGSFTDAQFAALLESCRSELEIKQERFKVRTSGSGQWFYDLDDLTLTINEKHFLFTPVGTFSPQRGTWLWGWANDEFPPLARDKASRIQKLHETTGFRVFVNRGIRTSPADALDLAALALHQLDGIALFIVPEGNDHPRLYLAVHEPD